VIVIRVEIWPHGIEAAKREIGIATIANDGTGTDEIGHYRASFALVGPRRRWTRASRVVDFKRLQKNIWALIREALNNALCLD
jgi:hypothetical protein